MLYVSKRQEEHRQILSCCVVMIVVVSLKCTDRLWMQLSVEVLSLWSPGSCVRALTPVRRLN